MGEAVHDGSRRVASRMEEVPRGRTDLVFAALTSKTPAAVPQRGRGATCHPSRGTVWHLGNTSTLRPRYRPQLRPKGGLLGPRSGPSGRPTATFGAGCDQVPGQPWACPRSVARQQRAQPYQLLRNAITGACTPPFRVRRPLDLLDPHLQAARVIALTTPRTHQPCTV